jgi:mRNA interferase RelE/StbE
MNWKLCAVLIYLGISFAGLLWYTWRTLRRKERLEVAAFGFFLLLPLMSPLLLIMAVDARRQKRKRTEEERAKEVRLRGERAAFRQFLDEAKHSASQCVEFAPTLKNACIAALAEFDFDLSKYLSLSAVSEDLKKLWVAPEAVTPLVEAKLPPVYGPISKHQEYSNLRFRIPDEWLLALSKEFVKSIHNIDRKLQGRILEALAEIARDPMTPKGDTVKPLTHELSGLWRYRLGDFRLIYQPVPAQKHILLVAFASRAEAYS